MVADDLATQDIDSHGADLIFPKYGDLSIADGK